MPLRFSSSGGEPELLQTNLADVKCNNKINISAYIDKNAINLEISIKCDF